MRSIIIVLTYLILTDFSQAGDLLTQAQGLVKQNEPQKAVELLANQIEKLDFSEKILLSDLYEKTGDSKSAIQVLNSLLATNSKSVAILFRLGKLSLTLDEKSALKYFQNVLEINKKHKPTYQELIKHYENKNNNYELKALYQSMNEVFGNQDDIIIKLCELQYKEHFYESAIKHCQSLIQKKSLYPEAYIYLGLSQIHMDNKVDGEKSLLRAAELFPRSESALYEYAKLKEEQKDIVTAYKYYKLSMDANPKSVKAILGSANAGFSLKKYDEALANFIKACELDKTSLPDLRKASNVLRLQSVNHPYQIKYDKAQESCNY